MRKESVLQKDITVLNACEPNSRALKYKKQQVTELKGKVDKSVLLVWDFNTPLSLIDQLDVNSAWM